MSAFFTDKFTSSAPLLTSSLSYAVIAFSLSLVSLWMLKIASIKFAASQTAWFRPCPRSRHFPDDEHFSSHFFHDWIVEESWGMTYVEAWGAPHRQPMSLCHRGCPMALSPSTGAGRGRLVCHLRSKGLRIGTVRRKSGLLCVYRPGGLRCLG